jgi:hypothetical protein
MPRVGSGLPPFVLDYQTGRRGDHFVRSKQCGKNAHRTNNSHYNATVPDVKKLLQHFLLTETLQLPPVD